MWLNGVIFFLAVCFVIFECNLSICKASKFEEGRDFIFIRHGQTDWGRDDILKGPVNLSLNDTGRSQALSAAHPTKENVSTPPTVFSSPLSRAQETAEIVCRNLPTQPNVETIDDLQERYYGDYSKMPMNGDIHCFTPADKEGDAEFQERVKAAFNTALRKTPTSRSLILVSHQKVFEFLSEWLTGNSLRLDQGGVCAFRFKSGRYAADIIQ